jgi:hypothetical protein
MTETDLIAFLAARLDEDEAAAMAATGTAWAWEATGDKDNSWAVGYVEGEDGRPLSGEIGHGQGVVIDGVCESINGHLADAAHIARHDPARVLREVEAKRRILAEHSGNHKCGWWIPGCPTVEALAAVYSDHPDYQPGGKP